MKKQPPAKKLHKPMHPVLSKPVLLGVLLLSIILLFVVVQSQYTIPLPELPQPPTATLAPFRPQPTHPWLQEVFSTITPTPVDTTTWKTYTDWKYGFSIKLPPQYYSMQPGKGATGSNPDPTGGGEMNFEDC